MTAKTRNRFFIGSLISVFVMTVVVFSHAAKPLSLISRASSDPSFSVSMSQSNYVSRSSKANSSDSSHFDNTATYRTSRGNILTLSCTNSVSDIKSSSYISEIYGGSALTVTSDFATAGKSFQRIDSITIQSGSANDRTAKLYFNGSDTANSLTVPRQSSATYDCSALGYNVRSFIINTSSASAFQTLRVLSLIINYSCSNDYSDETTLTGISVDSSGAKTEYTVGESFTSTGIVVTATYSDLSQLVVSPTSISTPDLSSAGEKTVTVYYTEGGITKDASYTITVSEAPSGLSGTYVGTYTSIEFTSDTTGTYIYGSERLYFTYTISGSNITFTYSSGDNTNFGSYRLFTGGSSPKANSTGSIVSGTRISVTTYNMFESATTRNFNK